MRHIWCLIIHFLKYVTHILKVNVFIKHFHGQRLSMAEGGLYLSHGQVRFYPSIPYDPPSSPGVIRKCRSNL